MSQEQERLMAKQREKERYNIPVLRNAEVQDRQGQSHTIETIVQPQRLSSDKQQALVQELGPLTGLGFMRSDIYDQALFDDVAHHVLGCDRLVVARHEDETSGYLSVSLQVTEAGLLYHLEGVILHPDFQGSGLVSRLLELDFQVLQPKLLGFHTQSQKMYALGMKYAHLNEIDAVRYGHHIGSRNQQGAVDIARYGGQSLYESSEFAALALPNIDWQRGDASVCVGPLKIPNR